MKEQEQHQESKNDQEQAEQLEHGGGLVERAGATVDRATLSRQRLARLVEFAEADDDIDQFLTVVATCW